ncbi:hypothetical protein PVAND_005580 [Polypedilum vanderplanki]|uniref:Intraflagellar transport protein 74-like protein n=1 Tax=Polypedilum vanderplanki TaxID=319348 RepID=A0A9J6C1C0_POLVA|nr:hypothetical protein PVAND_005580 [Polypedilum vanderplanki]
MDTSRPTSRPMSRRDVMDEVPSTMTQSTRIGTASRLSALPANRLNTSKNIGIFQKGMSDRPLTQQQGLSGITTSYGRIGMASSSMRQVKDKRYWMALIQSKVQEIMQETEKLKREKKNLDRETSARKLYEKKVKEQAKELSTLHAKLTEMNLALDTGGNGASRQLLQNESIAFREKNEAMQNQLEQIFKDRQAKENQNQQLEEAIENEKAKVNELIFSLNPDDQNKYREYQIVCEKLKNENADIHGKIEETVKRKEKLSANLMNSQSRLEAIKLQSKLREVIAKRNQLKDEEVNRLTPAQEREKLISEVRVNNQSINSINKQMKIVSDQLNEKKEYLMQIEQDLEEGKNSSERFVKFKELKKRDEMMTAFMETFQSQLAQEKQHVELLKNQITFAIEQITLQGMTSKEIGNVKISTAVLNENPNNLNSHGGLVKEYGRLQIQLKQLKILEKRLNKQLNELNEAEVNLIADIKRFSNTNTLRDEYAAKYEETSTIMQELKDKKRVTENVVRDAERQYSEIKDALRSNETYRQISHMEEKLTDLLKDNKSLQSSIEEFNKEFDFSETKKAAQQKVDHYNKLLCEDLRSRSSQNKYSYASN